LGRKKVQARRLNQRRLNQMMSELGSSSSRLAKFEKCESRQDRRDDHFEKEYNAEIGHYRQTLRVCQILS
jgi:hypothetical protein